MSSRAESRWTRRHCCSGSRPARCGGCGSASSRAALPRSATANGTRPAHALDPPLAARVVAFARDGYAGLNGSHLRDLLAEREAIVLSRPSVRCILRSAAWPARARAAPCASATAGSTARRRACWCSSLPRGIAGFGSSSRVPRDQDLLTSVVTKGRPPNATANTARLASSAARARARSCVADPPRRGAGRAPAVPPLDWRAPARRGCHSYRSTERSSRNGQRPLQGLRISGTYAK